MNLDICIDINKTPIELKNLTDDINEKILVSTDTVEKNEDPLDSDRFNWQEKNSLTQKSCEEPSFPYDLLQGKWSNNI